MKNFIIVLGFLPLGLFAQKDPAALVNPFIGTGGHGHTFPGASLPFGMMQLSPDTRMADWDGSSGYHYSDSVIYGFSHTHLSGTGIPDYCDILFMPFTGNVKWEPEDYRSTFSHKNEKAEPGYYQVRLDKDNIRAELTTALRSGMHQYSFPAKTNEAGLLIDLVHRDKVLDSYIEQVNAHEIRGYRKSRSWAQDQAVYFYLRFEQPITEFVINDSGSMIKSPSLKGNNIKASVKTRLGKDKKLRCRIGISGVSMEGAQRNLSAEIRDWNFEKLKGLARSAWNKELGKIELKGGKKDQQTVFYTALYHTMLAPNVFQDVDGSYRGTDGKIHKSDDFTNYTVFSLWDTYRALHPLMNIINQKRTTDWIKTFLVQYQQGGMLPVWELAGNETFCMIGYHSVPVILDAWQKGIRGFDQALALQAMRSYAESDRFGLEHYRNNGFISNELEHESVSKTLEYAYDDWCIAQFAKLNGDEQTYKEYIKRAQFYKNVFDPHTHHMRGKVEARWYHPFDPKEINNFFTEGNSWQYSFAVPHDIETLIQLHGGKTAFVNKLNELFTTSSQTTGRDQADVTGLIGQYAHGNEPSHHMAYLFNYVGQPWRTQELVNRICKEFYTNAPDGLIGNEDCGQMSAWYVFSAMGFYPVTPGSNEYILTSPLFDEIIIHLENGKEFKITSRREDKGSKYIRQVRVNGKNSDKSFIHYNDIKYGGRIEFDLSNSKNVIWGAREKDIPSSKISDELIVPVPFFDVTTKRFRDSMLVSILHLDDSTRIFIDKEEGHTNNDEYAYQGPFYIKNSVTFKAYAEKNGKKSKMVSQSFHKIENDYAIQVLSKVHPMYTAGGPEALLDEEKGSTQWRSGGWQSYYAQDFEAIVDLKQIKKIREVSVHVLQDVSPWILYPKEVIFYTSMDGKNFTEAGRILNTIGTENEGAQMQEMGIQHEMQTRFIKIRAINGGSLPAWHESAGNHSHLFIDEISIR